MLRTAITLTEVGPGLVIGVGQAGARQVGWPREATGTGPEPGPGPEAGRAWGPCPCRTWPPTQTTSQSRAHNG